MSYGMLKLAMEGKHRWMRFHSFPVTEGRPL